MLELILFTIIGMKLEMSGFYWIVLVGYLVFAAIQRALED